MDTPFFTGLTLGASIIVAIGAQNAFILRQGLSGSYVVSAAAFAMLCDAVLIALGLLGMGSLIAEIPSAMIVLRIIALGFLLICGFRAAANAARPHDGLVAATQQSETRRHVIIKTLGFSLLNPHVYLDTVILIGSVGAQLPVSSRVFFGIGAATASVLWFSLLGFGASKAAEILATPRAWRFIESTTAICLFYTAYQLLTS